LRKEEIGEAIGYPGKMRISGIDGAEHKGDIFSVVKFVDEIGQ
jgi:hypothetical protein